MKSKKHKYTAQCELEDFIQCANIGLIDAMNRYDVNHTAQANFNTYAHWHIRKAIQEYLKKYGQIIRLPAEKQDNVELYKKMVSFTCEHPDWLMTNYYHYKGYNKN